MEDLPPRLVGLVISFITPTPQEIPLPAFYRGPHLPFWGSWLEFENGPDYPWIRLRVFGHEYWRATGPQRSQLGPFPPGFRTGSPPSDYRWPVYLSHRPRPYGALWPEHVPFPSWWYGDMHV